MMKNEKPERKIVIENNGFDCDFQYDNLNKTINGKVIINL